MGLGAETVVLFNIVERTDHDSVAGNGNLFFDLNAGSLQKNLRGNVVGYEKTVLNYPYTMADLIGDKILVPGLQDGDGGSIGNTAGKLGVFAGKKNKLFIFHQDILEFFMAGDRGHTGDIHLALQKKLFCFSRTGFDQFDIHMGVSGKELGQDIWKHLHAALNRDPEPEFAVIFLDDLFDLFFQVFVDGENLSGSVNIALSGVGKCNRRLKIGAPRLFSTSLII